MKFVVFRTHPTLLTLATIGALGLSQAAFACDTCKPGGTTTATWTFEKSSSNKFADGTASDTVSSHVFDSDTAGFSMTVSAWGLGSTLDTTKSTLALPSLTGLKLAPAKDTTESGIGIYNGSDNELRNDTSYFTGSNAKYNAEVLEISNLTAPKGETIESIDFIINSVDPSTKEGFVIYGSNCATKGCTLTRLDLQANNGKQSADGFSFTVADTYADYWITSDNGSNSSVIFGSGTTVTAKCPPVPEPSSYLMMFAALGVIGVSSAKRAAKR